VTLNLTSHNGLLAVDWPWHNRDTPEYGENVPYIELRDGLKSKRFDASITNKSPFWKEFSNLLKVALNDMSDRGLLRGYTNVRMPNGHIIQL
jgi:hypothetical protein